MKNLVIEKNTIKENLRVIKQKAAGAAIIADLGANAYGLGLMETARLLRDDGVRIFGVYEPSDAAALRRGGFEQERIMMLRSTSDTSELEPLVDLGVVCSVGSHDDAMALNSIAEARGTVCEIQIRIDTGDGVSGFHPEELDKIASIYKHMPSLAVVGVYSAYSASAGRRRICQTQYEEFMRTAEAMRSLGLEPGMLHIADDAALFRFSFDQCGAVRVGPALAGVVPGCKVSALHAAGYILATAEEVGWHAKGTIVNDKKLSRAYRTATISVGRYNGVATIMQDDYARLWHVIRRQLRAPFGRIGKTKVRFVGNPGRLWSIIDVTGLTCTVGTEIRIDINPADARGLQRLYK